MYPLTRLERLATLLTALYVTNVIFPGFGLRDTILAVIFASSTYAGLNLLILILKNDRGGYR
jgi:hypothetical protein